MSAMSRRGTHREFLDLAAARLEEPLATPDAEWLDAHLATCDPCRAWVAGYVADRTALRHLRQAPPPRDLWAGISAALDREAARGSGTWILGRPVGRRTARAAFAAALSLVLLVAAAGTGLLPGFPGEQPTGEARATPFAVEPRILAYISLRDGEIGVYMGRIARVCPEPTAVDCLALESDVTQVASFTDFVPKQLAISPDGRLAAVVGTSSRGGAVYALRFPEPDAAPPSATPASAAPSPPLTPSLEPTPEPLPALIIENVVVVGEPPAYSPDGTMLAFSAMPADGRAGPDIYLWRAGEEAAVPLTDDHGSIFASWTGGSIVGSRAGPPAEDTAEKGADAGDANQGDRFTPASFILDPATGETRDLARPAWRPIVDPTGRFVVYWDGVLAASADGVTWTQGEGGLFFAEWALFDTSGEPGAEPTPEPTPDGAAEPTGEAATPEPAETAEASPAPEDETAEPTDATAEPTAGQTAEPAQGSAEPTPEGTAEPTAEESPGPPGEPEQLEAGRDYESEPVLSWEVRWSPDGEWFGVWVGDPSLDAGPDAGRLTAQAVDLTAGRLDRSRIELAGTPALRGFAMGAHRIAWATLPGEDDGSEIRLLFWSDTGRGEIRTTPGRGHNTLPAF